MEADDLEGIAVTTLIRFTSRKEGTVKTGALDQIAAKILEPRLIYEAR
jgi:hypothetical protein